MRVAVVTALEERSCDERSPAVTTVLTAFRGPARLLPAQGSCVGIFYNLSSSALTTLTLMKVTPCYRLGAVERIEL